MDLPWYGEIEDLPAALRREGWRYDASRETYVCMKCWYETLDALCRCGHTLVHHSYGAVSFSGKGSCAYQRNDEPCDCAAFTKRQAVAA